VVQNICDISFYKKIFKKPKQKPNTKEILLQQYLTYKTKEAYNLYFATK